MEHVETAIADDPCRRAACRPPARARGRGGRVDTAPTRRLSTKRERSACDSSTLSYSGRKRTGAGVAGSGRGASGTSNSGAPRSSLNTTSSSRHGVERGRKPCQARPRRHVGGTRRPERGEVADDEPGGSERSIERLAQPRLHRRHGHLVGAPPQTPRRHLHQRQPVAARERQRRRDRARGTRSPSADLSCGCVRGSSQIPPGPRHRRVEIDVAEQRCEVAMVAQLLLEHRLFERPDREAVGTGQRMDRAAQGS